MLHVWYIYLQKWVILFGKMLENIPAPWFAYGKAWFLVGISCQMGLMGLMGDDSSGGHFDRWSQEKKLGPQFMVQSCFAKPTTEQKHNKKL